jgi:hypothetical protein
MARSSTDNNALVGTNGTIRSVKITAPRNGYLFAVASSDVFNGTANNAPICFITLDGTTLSSTVRNIELNGTTGVNTEENCNTDGSWPVAQGRHTVAFAASGVAATTTFDEATLEVLFVPFNGRGGVPAPVVPTSLKASSGNG